MKLRFLTIVPFLLLCSCAGNSEPKEPVPARPIGDENYYALFMFNYPRMSDVGTFTGNEIDTESLLYERKVIQPGQVFSAPEDDPARPGYEFKGWFKEESCDNQWNFETDTTDSSVFLYAKWEITQEAEYVEPTFVEPDYVITDEDFVVKGVLNSPIKENDEVDLTAGAILRLEENKDDVKKLINFEHKQGVQMTQATYDSENKKVNISVSNGDDYSFTVKDITADLSVKAEKEYFETLASGYEKEENTENYHIMMAGSSSMEYWKTYKEDMDPIISYNHGIGGTTVQQWKDKLMTRLVAPYSPKAVVYYVGVNNIINSDDGGQKTGAELEKLFIKTHEVLPYTQIFYVLINKLPGFLNMQEEFDIANEAAISFAKENEWITCIDAGAGLLKASGLPHQAYFRTDGLHMSSYGYLVWGSAIKKAIIDWLG